MCIRWLYGLYCVQYVGPPIKVTTFMTLRSLENVLLSLWPGLQVLRVGPISLFRNSWLKYCKTFWFNFDSNHTRKQICTCHDSWTVVACAKLWPGQIINIHVIALHIFTIFGLWAHKVSEIGPRSPWQYHTVLSKQHRPYPPQWSEANSEGLF